MTAGFLPGTFGGGTQYHSKSVHAVQRGRLQASPCDG